MTRRPPDPRILHAAACLALACALACAPACDRQAAQKKTPAAGAPAAPTASAPPSVLEGVSYDPPEDGRLTEAQVRAYLEVKERARRAGGEGDRVAAELAAAKDLGHNPREFLWVEARIEEAQIERARESLDEQLAAGSDQYAAMLEARRGSEDPEAATPAGPEAAEAAPAPEDEAPAAVQANIELLAGFQERLAQVQSDEEKFAAGSLEADQPLAEELETGLGTDLEPPGSGEDP